MRDDDEGKPKSNDNTSQTCIIERKEKKNARKIDETKLAWSY